VHATAVTASQSMPAGQLSVCIMASCYNCCMHSLPGSIVPFLLVLSQKQKQERQKTQKKNRTLHTTVSAKHYLKLSKKVSHHFLS